MRRELFTADHEAFRQLVRDFVAKEVVPHYTEWEHAGRLPRKLFDKLGSLGVLGISIPEAYGGAGLHDYRYNVVLQEEAARALVTLGTVRTQLDVVLPYFLAYADEDQRERWFPGLAAGRLLTAVAMTEPARAPLLPEHEVRTRRGGRRDQGRADDARPGGARARRRRTLRRGRGQGQTVLHGGAGTRGRPLSAILRGYGYILEYPIARLYADARITRIYAGTSEVMKVIIAKSLGL